MTDWELRLERQLRHAAPRHAASASRRRGRVRLGSLAASVAVVTAAALVISSVDLHRSAPSADTTTTDGLLADQSDRAAELMAVFRRPSRAGDERAAPARAQPSQPQISRRALTLGPYSVYLVAQGAAKRSRADVSPIDRVLRGLCSIVQGPAQGSAVCLAMDEQFARGIPGNIRVLDLGGADAYYPLAVFPDGIESVTIATSDNRRVDVAVRNNVTTQRFALLPVRMTWTDLDGHERSVRLEQPRNPVQDAKRALKRARSRRAG